MRTLIALALATSFAPGVAAAQARAQGGQPRLRTCEHCTRDSAARARRPAHRTDLARLASLASELNMLEHRLRLDANEMEGRQRRELEARVALLGSEIAAITARLGPERAGHAFEEMRPGLEVARRAFDAAMMNAGRSAAVEAARFTGWIGITLDAPSAVRTRGDNVYWRFFEHPRIVSVEPSSPAERAGIRQGDVLLAYDGRDVRREIAMNRLLRPGRTVRVRIRVRGDNDQERDVPVIVAPAREGSWRAWTPAPSVATGRAPRSRSPRAAAEVWPAPTHLPGHADIVIGASPAPAPGSLALLRLNGLAGAHMETITRGLGEAIGVERGVLVLSVAPGVPAHESGLLDGDAIVKADGRDVATIHDLRAALAGAHDRAVRLEVARKGKLRQVTLRW